MIVQLIVECVERRCCDKFVLFRYTAARPVSPALAELDRSRIDKGAQSMVLVERAGAPAD